ncbi:MAG: beta-hydroxyacyl-ACP dehydratase [Pirellulales bacterium]|nr:beta-hydroxyacyl-ACP dehydratase [Pirellulales bacterium]
MRFTLIDRVLELEPGVRIVAVKNLSLAEEYLADHFPGFPVMPGVLMLEALVQAGAWLVRVTEQFAHSMVVLKEARNLRYARFVEPGECLRVVVEQLDASAEEVRLRGEGRVGEEMAVSARLVLARYNLADGDASRAEADAVVCQQMRQQFDLLSSGVGTGRAE